MRKFLVLIYFAIMLGLTTVLFLIINAYLSIDLRVSISITLYCFIPLIVCGGIRLLTRINKEIKASLMILVSGLFLVWLNGFLNPLLGDYSEQITSLLLV